MGKRMMMMMMKMSQIQEIQLLTVNGFLSLSLSHTEVNVMTKIFKDNRYSGPSILNS